MLNFDSLWVNERLFWPLNPRTPANSPDGKLPTYYQSVLDPLETLTFAAANTDKIVLGTSVIDMLFHNPVILARRLATLDVLSHGRSICGLGIGWSEDEYIASNIPYDHRAARANGEEKGESEDEDEDDEDEDDEDEDDEDEDEEGEE